MALHEEHNEEREGENTAIELDEQEKEVFCKLCKVTNEHSTHLTGDYFKDIIDWRNGEAHGVVYSLEVHKKLVEHYTKDYLLRLTPEGYEFCKKFCEKRRDIPLPVEVPKTEGSIGIRRT